MTGGVPDLGLNALVLDNEGTSLELDPDRGLGLEAKLVASEPGQNLRLAHRGVPYQHHLEHVVYLLVRIAISTRHSVCIFENDEGDRCEKRLRGFII